MTCCLLVVLIGGLLVLARSDTLDDLRLRLDEADEMFGLIWKTLKQNQLYVEEQTRLEGNSGLRQIRNNKIGTRSFYSESHTLRSAGSVHDHANYINSIGLGEFAAVLNGYEFRTRHNDFKLRQPIAYTEGSWGELEDVSFPEVPSEVLSKSTVDDQIMEMREWFKAFHTGNQTSRNYTGYFKPIVCYLEGYWSFPSAEIDEPFDSDRHQLDANSFDDLLQKVEFTSFTGRKSNLENYAYLPVRIVSIENDTQPLLAQWNYRIACQPLDGLDGWLGPDRLVLMDDIGARMAYKDSMEELEVTRAARYMFKSSLTASNTDTFYVDGLLDEVMALIPGRDGAGAVIHDEAFGETAYPVDSEANAEKLNTAYYSRFYKVASKDAMGLSQRNRGFSDRCLFMAQTTDPKVAPTSVSVCSDSKDPSTCQTYVQRWTYAIPLEIIYLTPLSTWNPYDIVYKGHFKTDEGKTVKADGRVGGMTEEEAWNGTNSERYYMTPDHFFTGEEVWSDPADTSQGAAGVLNSTGQVCAVRASGIRAFLPAIDGIDGLIRQRYPVFPVYMEGNPIYKELEALKILVTKSLTYRDMFIEQPGSSSGNSSQAEQEKVVTFLMSIAQEPTEHTHAITITRKQYDDGLRGAKPLVTTSQAAGHTHDLLIQYNGDTDQWKYTKCADSEDKCWDQHNRKLEIQGGI